MAVKEAGTSTPPQCATSFQWPYTLSPHSAGMAIEDVWPTLFFGTERLEEIQRKQASLGWAQQALAQMIQEAQEVIKRPPQVPVERIGWRHEFYSHQTAEHLLYDPESSQRYYDPWDGSFHHSEAQRAAWALLTHERTFRIMRSLGFLYGLTGSEAYGEWVAAGMRSAVEMFGRGDLRKHSREGALYYSPLYDAQVLLLLADAYGLTRESPAYEEALHLDIRRHVFEEAMPSQLGFFQKTGVHNFACYLAAALARVGDLLGRPQWVNMAFDDPACGLTALLEQGLREDDKGQVDGFWFEGTHFYHFYSLCPLVGLFEMALRQGRVSSELRQRFEKMFEAPLALADPQDRLICVGDLGAPKVMQLSAYRHLYEYAAGQLDCEKHGPVLRSLYARGAPRNSLAALAYGPDKLTTARRTEPPRSLRAAGIATFCGATPAGEFYAFFRAGRHGAGHDHADKLSIGLHALGQVIATDLGTAGYALGDFKSYCASTFAHNTLMVDEQNQAPVQEAGLSCADKEARGVIEDAYEGVRLARSVRFDPPLLILQDRCQSEAQHRYGWVFHAYGSLSLRCDETSSTLDLPPIPVEGPLAWLSNRRTMGVEGVLSADWRVSDQVRLRLLVTSDGPFEATAGRTPGNPIPDSQGTVFLRAPGQVRTFQAIFEVHQGAPTLSGWSDELFEGA